LSCRLAGCRKATGCPVGKYTELQDFLVGDPAKWQEVECKACRSLLASAGFDAEMAEKSMEFALQGNQNIAPDSAGVEPQEEPQQQHAEEEQESDAEVDNALAFHALVTSIDAHLEARCVCVVRLVSQ